MGVTILTGHWIYKENLQYQSTSKTFTKSCRRSAAKLVISTKKVFSPFTNERIFFQVRNIENRRSQITMSDTWTIGQFYAWHFHENIGLWKYCSIWHQRKSEIRCRDKLFFHKSPISSKNRHKATRKQAVALILCFDDYVRLTNCLLLTGRHIHIPRSRKILSTITSHQ